MKDYKELVAAMCDYCGLDNLYPYENLEEIQTEFENYIDDMANNRISMLIREKKLNDRIKELEKQTSNTQEQNDRIKKLEKQIYDMEEQNYNRGIAHSAILVSYRNEIRGLEDELAKYKKKEGN